MTRINQLVLFLSKAMQNPTISKFCNTLSPLSVYSGMDPFYMLKKTQQQQQKNNPYQYRKSHHTAQDIHTVLKCTHIQV